MKFKTLFVMNALALALMACDSGDIKLQPTHIDNSVGNTGGGGGGETNPCATYTTSAGQTVRAAYAPPDCIYSASFVSDSKPLTADLFIPELDNNGLHIFLDSLFVGQDVDGEAAASGTRVPQNGEGPTLTVEAGARVAFTSSADYIRIARGSRIIADGTAAKPIIFSSVRDLRDGEADEGDRGLWGGVQINGNGLTNKCVDAQRMPTGNNPHNCHAIAEGRPASYGGNDNTEDSGTLRYVVIKHAGFEVVEGSELNGLTLNGVGSGTTIEYVQVYTTQDDGFEMFGGAVNLKHVVGVNVGDDTFDFSEGWVGNIQFALSVDVSGSNYCVEADNTGSGRADDIAPLTKGRISNMTCVLSNVAVTMGEFPSGKGASRGAIFREGAIFEMYNSIILANTEGMTQNQCLVLTDSEGPQTIGAAKLGWSAASSNLIACTDPTTQNPSAGENSDFVLATWLQTAPNANNAIRRADDAGALPVVALQGWTGNALAYPRPYQTAAAISEADTTVIDIPVFDATRLQDNFSAGAVPALDASGSSTFFEEVDFIGAVGPDNDWTAGWTVGLVE